VLCRNTFLNLYWSSSSLLHHICNNLRDMSWANISDQMLIVDHSIWWCSRSFVELSLNNSSTLLVLLSSLRSSSWDFYHLSDTIVILLQNLCMLIWTADCTMRHCIFELFLSSTFRRLCASVSFTDELYINFKVIANESLLLSSASFLVSWSFFRR